MHVQEWDGVESRINVGGDLEKKIGDDVGLDLGLTTITLVAIFCLPFFFLAFMLHHIHNISVLLDIHIISTK